MNKYSRKLEALKKFNFNSPFFKVVGRPSCRSCGSMEWEKFSNGPDFTSISVMARFPERAKSETM